MAATVLNGAVLVSDTGTSATYKDKCESCGYVGSSTKHMNSSGSGHTTFTTSFKCPKCGKRQEIKIKH